MAVGIEAVQQKFQPALDAYITGILDENELKEATEWEARWYWSFDGYIPVLRACRDLGLPLLALDISSEDRKRVETGGLQEVLDDDEHEYQYVPDQEAFRRFGNTTAYRKYVNYTLKPPYELSHPRTNSNSNRNSDNIKDGERGGSNGGGGVSFSNFVARQMLRDEGMASASARWLSANPDGLLVACLGINHVTFGCGVPGRVKRMLLSSTPSSSSTAPVGETQQDPSSVASVLINPEPLNTGTELEICNKDGTLAMDDHDEDESRIPLFAHNNRKQHNQVCIENSVELQNYALQFEFVSPSSSSASQREAILEEAASAMQATRGKNVLGLSDYLIFSPKLETNY
uniref:Haem-binding uptake Tiki superfamily ChaN domain-containing protein n=2 Tax=Pseudo-nitzschia australis TaxID=44445 RepID=A0A7S4AFP3_9STRA|mmetsp:Transcript_11685/g.23092  ORF Transcript_11685/g.23092 Transcript_11685/m.23092 type:complete len:345 (-) Transcript_11685:1329-2363(-)